MTRGQPALAVVIGVVGIGVGIILLVEDDERRLLALADLRAEFGPLTSGAPNWCGEALHFGRYAAYALA
jgi:hypothetical protein